MKSAKAKCELTPGRRWGFTEIMRQWSHSRFTAALPCFCIGIVIFAAFCGCAGHKQEEFAAVPVASGPVVTKGPQKVIMTPDTSLAGRIVIYSQSGRYAVINFPLGQMPAIDHKLDLYRNGLKVGVLKVTGPQQDDNIIADLVEGDCQVGDEARDR